MFRLAAALLVMCSCGRDRAGAPPSDEAMLAARGLVAARLAELFESGGGFYGEADDASGSATTEGWLQGSPDIRQFAPATAVDLPAATPRLARCHETSASALAAFHALDGPAFGEGRMGGPRDLSLDQKVAEVRRQLAATISAYCLWRDATRICREEATAAGLAPPTAFEPEFLECTAAPPR